MRAECWSLDIYCDHPDPQKKGGVCFKMGQFTSQREQAPGAHCRSQAREAGWTIGIKGGRGDRCPQHAQARRP